MMMTGSQFHYHRNIIISAHVEAITYLPHMPPIIPAIRTAGIHLKGIHLLMPRFGLHLSSGFHLQLPKYFSNLDTAILFNCAREENHMDGQTPLKSIPTRRWTDPKTVIQYINIKDDLKPPKGLCNCKRIRLRAQTNYYYYSHHH